MRRLKRLLLLAVLIAACARIAAPPGGAPRNTPPLLVGSYPDSGVAPCKYDGDAEFRFDEVTSDAGEPNFGYGNGALERLIVFSPDTTVPKVEWHRDRITVRPRHGWRDSTVYRIELLPGVVDLHNNTSKTGTVIAFRVCGARPSRTISGRVIDWAAGRGVRDAWVEAIHLPDSLRYRGIADTTGRFHFEGLPNGPYIVMAGVDQNRDHRRNDGEAWDTVRVAATVDSAGEIWAFVRDTLKPAIQNPIVAVDSEFISVTFTRPIDPSLRFDTTQVRVAQILATDTVSIGVMEAYPKAYSDSIHKPVPLSRKPSEDSAFRVDSLRRDSIAKANAAAGIVPPKATVQADLPTQQRPKLGSVIVIRTRGRIRPDTRYYIELRGVRTAGGQVGTVHGVLITPKAPSPADSLKTKADSMRADSTRKADSTKRAAGRGGPGRAFQ